MKQKAAIIPFKKRKSGIQILLVRNMTNTKWIIPKGNIDKNLGAHISATKEAYEEAGVLGRPHPVVVGRYARNNQQIPTYLLEVDVSLKHYQETEKRKRKWIRPTAIDVAIKEDDLRKILHRGVNIIEKNGSYFKFLMRTFLYDLQIEPVLISKSVCQFKPKGSKRVIRVSRNRTVLEMLVETNISTKEAASFSKNQTIALLTQNGKTPIGYWGLKQKRDKRILSRIHKTELRTLDFKSFNEIFQALLQECQTFEKQNAATVLKK